MLMTCAPTNQTAGDGGVPRNESERLDIYLGPKEAGAIRAGITGKGYVSASGPGVVPAPDVAQRRRSVDGRERTGNASPMQNLSCQR